MKIMMGDFDDDVRLLSKLFNSGLNSISEYLNSKGLILENFLKIN